MPALPAKSSRIVVPERPRWHQRIAARVIFLLLKALTRTMRLDWTERAGLRDNKTPGPVIFCLWHNRLALAPIAYKGYIVKHMKNAGLAAMTSASRDGALLSAVLDCCGMQPVRGSSSRRGSQALRELSTWARRGYNLAITPDGPRGPRYVLQPGIIALAQVTGLPVVPFTCHLERKIVLKSWDGFQIPMPFSRAEVIFGEPLCVPRETSEAGREELRARLEAIMKTLAVD